MSISPVVVPANLLLLLLYPASWLAPLAHAGFLPFFSGNEPTGENIHSSNLYWGFMNKLEKHYKLLIRAHSGVVNDYSYLFVVLFVVIMVALVIGGLL